MKQAKMGGFGDRGQMYECHHPWPDNCSVQGGSSGVVFSKNGNYRTAFFEAFPKEPATFIRGEGQTIEEAEKNAWEKYSRILDCPGHEFERRGYKSGVGYCKHCDYQKEAVFPPDTHCKICGCPTNWKMSKKKEFYCQDHKDKIPEEDLFEWQKESADPLAIFDMLFSEEE